MSRRTDLGKLVKKATDVHEKFRDELPVNQWGTPKSYRESREFAKLRERHYLMTSGQVSFSTFQSYRVRRLVVKYLRRYG